MTEYEYRAYCDVCKTGLGWVPDVNEASVRRLEHFDTEHEDIPSERENRLVKTNARIQRRQKE